MARRILIVDDEPLMLSSIQRDLCELPPEYELLFANNGKEALQKFVLADIALLITDIFMPEIEGLGLITAVRSKYPAVKIIAMSGGGIIRDLQYLDFAKKLGTAQTLAKPFTKEELLSVIYRAFAQG